MHGTAEEFFDSQIREPQTHGVPKHPVFASSRLVGELMIEQKAQRTQFQTSEQEMEPFISAVNNQVCLTYQATLVSVRSSRCGEADQRLYAGISGRWTIGTNRDRFLISKKTTPTSSLDHLP